MTRDKTRERIKWERGGFLMSCNGSHKILQIYRSNPPRGAEVEKEHPQESCVVFFLFLLKGGVVEVIDCVDQARCTKSR